MLMFEMILLFMRMICILNMDIGWYWIFELMVVRDCESLVLRDIFLKNLRREDGRKRYFFECLEVCIFLWGKCFFGFKFYGVGGVRR